MNTEENPSIQEEQVAIPNYLRFNKKVAWVAFATSVLFCSDSFSSAVENGNFVAVIICLIGVVTNFHFIFSIVAEQAYSYKERGTYDWRPLGIIVGANLLSFLWDPFALLSFCAVFFSERITAEETSKITLSFVKKASWISTIGFFVLIVIFCFDSKEFTYDEYYEELNNTVLANKQRIYENVHHPFGSCNSAQVKNLNIEWDGNSPKSISYEVELFWKTLLTSNGYTRISIKEVYNYNTKQYETARCEVVETNGQLSGDFWWDVGWGIGTMLAL